MLSYNDCIKINVTGISNHCYKYYKIFMKNIATDYLNRLGIDYQLLRSYGATEVFPPEDADMIIDNTSTLLGLG